MGSWQGEMRRDMLKHATLWPALWVLLSGLASAQSAVQLTLDEAIVRGLANSLRLAELQAREEAAAAIENGRAADRMPVISVQGGYTRTNHVEEFVIRQPGQLTASVLYPDAPNNYRSRLDLQWPIYTGGRTDAL